jgi:hypothetical protein
MRNRSMLRMPLPTLVSTLAIALAAGRAQASDYDLVELHTVSPTETTVNLRGPILSEGGDAYWNARTDTEDADVLGKDGGVIATVPDLPPLTTGDVPLKYAVTDEHGGSLALGGSLLIPAVPMGQQQLNAFYLYPGFTRIMDYTVPVAGFPNDPVFTVPEHPPLFDQDGSIVFLLRDGTNFASLRYAICRLVGSAVSVLVEQGVTLTPDGVNPFTRVFAPTVSKGRILFYGEGGGRKGVYQLANGTISTVVDNQTVLPPNAAPISILSAADVVFANDGDDVAVGLRQGTGGVWKRVGGVWSQLAVPSDPMPGGSGIFYDFVAVAIRDGVVAFASRRANPFLPPRDAGIYTDAGGRLHSVASLVADLGAEAATELVVAGGGRWFDGVDVVFGAENSSWGGFYRAVPEPASMLGAGAAIAALLAIRRSRGARRTHRCAGQVAEKLGPSRARDRLEDA